MTTAAALLKKCFADKRIEWIPAIERQSGFSYWLLPSGEFRYMGDRSIHRDVAQCMKVTDYDQHYHFWVNTPGDEIEEVPRMFERKTGAIKADAFEGYAEFEVSLDKKPTSRQLRAIKDTCSVKGRCRLSVWNPKREACIRNREVRPETLEGQIAQCRLSKTKAS